MPSNSVLWNTSCPPSLAIAGGGSHIIITSGDRFMNAVEINYLFEQESPAGQLYLRLKEVGIPVEREWWIDEEGIAYMVDLALPVLLAGDTGDMSHLGLPPEGRSIIIPAHDLRQMTFYAVWRSVRRISFVLR
jgi:hypothetical protein